MKEIDNKSELTGLISKFSKIMKLSKNEQEVALKIARQTLEKEFGLRKEIDKNYQKYEIFNQNLGVFVTLHKDNQLRGCVGLIEAVKPLAVGIVEMAVSSAFYDSRFEPLAENELEKIKIEISALSLPKKTTYDQIKLGRHGVIVKKGFQSGVFLPQVAEETGWTKQEFMSHLCADKAGLDKECCNDPQTEIYSFEAFVFSEQKSK